MQKLINTACQSRRHFLAQQGLGVGSLALMWLLKQEGALAEPGKPALERPTYDLLPKTPHREPQAQAMISLFMQGGPSHLDLFDPKPELVKRHMTNFEGEIKYDNAAESSAKLFAPQWKFSPRGECGMELSDLLPGLSEVADEITLIRSMKTGVDNHGQSLYALNTGRFLAGRPSLGSWLTYGLGSESQNMPAFVVLTDPGGLPVLGTEMWTNGFLPSLFQGTVVRPREPRILNLDPPPQYAGKPQQRFLEFLGQLNRQHLNERPFETDYAARIASYELAARMQSSANEALDLTKETEATHKMYGLDEEATREYGSRCLIARRLIERGVRYVQVFTSTQQWDHHGSILSSLPSAVKKTDKPSAALVKDLKSRGLLDSTVVHWGGEMGRLPVIQNEKNIGRDHNTFGFSMWVAGGGFKNGHVHGETDEFGHKAVTDVVNHYDYHATLMYLFGLEPSQFFFQRPTGQDTLLDGQPGEIVSKILKTPPTV
ncbi:MAG: DUF1501 domain-containing protein [Planctomycetota bacterium]|nr:DUF1501 domain-containing protein [Planctomycetota bacterium]MDA1212118.1 DUF1501 domain-containing protein [Planctomycetota bacterium]